MKVYEITLNTSGKVRLNLSLEDIYFPQEAVLIGFELIKKHEHEGEEYAVFKEPIRVPRFNKFYGSRIKSTSDPYLEDLIRRILYLNPNPDRLLQKKIVEVILLQFTAIEMVESKVKMGQLTPKPVLTFEQVEAALAVMLMHPREYTPDNETNILFYREGTISKQDKIRLRAYHRAQLVKGLLASAIHTVAEHLIDSQIEIKVTHTRIEDTKMVTTSKGPASVRTIRKYMNERTQRIVEEHNSTAPFKSEVTKEKYYCYMSMPIDSSLNEIIESLQVSKSTAAEFKKRRKNQRLPELESLEINVSTE